MGGGGTRDTVNACEIAGRRLSLAIAVGVVNAARGASARVGGGRLSYPPGRINPEPLGLSIRAEWSPRLNGAPSGPRGWGGGLPTEGSVRCTWTR